MNNTDFADNLPINHDTKAAQNLSLLLLVLMSLASLAGLLLPDMIYPSEELVESYRANDAVNLILGVPVLLASISLVRRGSLTGLLLWPGALLYTFYNYTAYLFGIPLRAITLVNAVIVLLSAYLIFSVSQNIDGEAVKERLGEVVRENIGGWVLVAFGIMFILRAASVILVPLMDGTSLPISEVGLSIADGVLSILWIVGGIALLRQLPVGYASGLGLLFAGSALFIGLLLFFVLQPLLTSAPFVMEDAVVILVMGLFCFVPFGLYLRAVIVEK
ncbi:MAG: hypothetical protein DWQ07_16035 [Chloroflexi bacterium]|nr:MAG: hypothetical protein DWQ07_16035 [Chloroflexota bacterium]MBL1195261.1 hypothetical protein [Chloroflexota bacterium]NOH12547.1 hypothetical protein [Chloroflexota bacterium]